MAGTDLENLNPFQDLALPATATSTAVAREEARAIAEIQGAIIVAQRFPRNRRQAMDRILKGCTRKALAEQAIYSYPRGGTQIEGPSIRLAELIAQEWGNMIAAIREVGQSEEASMLEAVAWDLESNVRIAREFLVPKQRKARGEIVTLTDPRDIYELNANQGARRLRACILTVVPGDVVEAAVEACRQTQVAALEGAPAEVLEKLADSFEAFNVSRAAIARRLGHRLEASTAAEVINLRRVYVSLRDGMGKPGEYFELDAEVEVDPEVAEINRKLAEGGERMDAGTGEIKPAAKEEPVADPADVGPTATEIVAMFKKAGDREAFDAAADVMRSARFKRGTRDHTRCDEAMSAARQRLELEDDPK